MNLQRRTLSLTRPSASTALQYMSPQAPAASRVALRDAIADSAATIRLAIVEATLAANARRAFPYCCSISISTSIKWMVLDGCKNTYIHLGLNVIDTIAWFTSHQSYPENLQSFIRGISIFRHCTKQLCLSISACVPQRIPTQIDRTCCIGER